MNQLTDEQMTQLLSPLHDISNDPEPAAASAVPPRSIRHFPVVRAGIMASVAAGVLAAVALAPWQGSGSSPIAVDSAAAAMLQRVGRSAGEQSWQLLKPGQFVYSKNIHRFYIDSSITKHRLKQRYVPDPPRVTNEFWKGYDGTDYWSPDKRGEPQGTQHFAFWWGLSYQQLIAVSADPVKLRYLFRDVIHSKAARDSQVGSDSDMIFQAATDLLGLRPVLPPALQKAAYQALASLPDMRNLGTATDMVGRKGILISRPENSEHPEYGDLQAIINPDTGELLETRDVNGTDHGRYSTPGEPSGAMESQHATITQAVTSQHTRPSGQ